MQNIKILHRFAYFPPPVLGTAARLINIKALINSASHWKIITVPDCKHSALEIEPVCQHLSKGWKFTMATKAIFRLFSLRKEDHIISFLFSSCFHVLLGPYSTGFHGMPNPRSSVISNTRISFPGYCFSPLT